jgi:hypothetical protein
MAKKRRKGRGKLLLRDLEFDVQEGILFANIADPAGMEEYVERYKHVPCAEFHWWLRIEMRELAVESKIDDEIQRDYWKPAIYDNHLTLARVRRWIDLVGQAKSWDSPFDIKTGIPNGGFYVWEHESIPKATLRFVQRKGRQFRIHWKGLCNVYWAEKYNDNLPFELDTWVRFT